MTRFLNNLQPWGAFLLRLILGCAMIYHGYHKVIPAGSFNGHNAFSAMQHHSHVVVSLGLPYWLGYVSALTEFFGGILILLGFFTRFAAFMVAINMLVALIAVDLRHGYAHSELPLALFAIAVMLLFYGAGALALDRKIGFS
jgi:putative oxidoreductase